MVVDPDHTDTPAASPAGGWAEHLLEAAAAIAEAVRHGAPRDALSAQLHLLAMVNGQPAKGPNVVNVDFTTPRRTADTRGPADVAPRPAATEPRSAVASEEVSKGFSRETPLTDFLEPRDEPRTNPRPRPRDATADDAQQSRLKALLAPLLRTIERSTPPKQLNGVSHWGGVIDALGPLTDAQIRRGVDAANRLAQNGKLDSPIGWLIKRAAAADTEIFGPPTEPAGPTATRAGVTEEPSADGAEFVTADQFRERTSR
ncbi:MAG TPA: hypothetical protein VHD87_15095 [Acidimicrobiales bacterium]|nr:hypothetical protein [Acidimicrobiales bacterium]